MNEVLSPAPNEFPHTLAQAAILTNQDPRALCDFIRTGALPFALRWTGDLETSVWLSSDDVRTMVRSPDGSPVENLTPAQQKVLVVCRATRALLNATGPETQASEAIARKTGLVAQNRQRVAHVYVRAEDVAAYARHQGQKYFYATLATVVANALSKSGASAVRGIRGLGDDKQSWATWHRLPHSLVQPEIGDAGRWHVDFPQLDPDWLIGAEESPLLIEPTS